MDYGLLLPNISNVDQTTLAVRAENLGYESIWLGELWGTSSPIQLAGIAGQTEKITLGTAILNVFSRTPATLAMTVMVSPRFEWSIRPWSWYQYTEGDRGSPWNGLRPACPACPRDN